MNGRQSGAVRYLASLSLYYYSLGLLRRFVSSLVCVVSHFSFSHLSPSVLLFFSLFLCLLSAPSLMLFFFFLLLWPHRQAAWFFPLRLFCFNGLSRSFAGDQVRRTGDRTSCTTCSSYRIGFLYSSCARFAEKLTVIFSLSAFRTFRSKDNTW